MDRDEFTQAITDAVAAVYAEKGQSVHIIKGVLMCEALIDDRDVRQVIAFDIGVSKVLPWELAGFAVAMQVNANRQLMETMQRGEEEDDDD